MKKNVLVFGIISGIIAVVPILISIGMESANANYSGGMWVGYTSMIVAFSLIFVGIKNLRDKFSNGFISFGQAFKTGAIIALIGSTVYVVAWLIDFYNFHPDFMKQYAANVIAHAKASGDSPAQIAAQQAKMATYTEMYKNPLMVIVLTYMEILPVGLVIALIAALILKRKQGSTPGMVTA